MKDVRIGNDISVIWSLYSDQKPFLLDGLKISVYLKGMYGKTKIEDYTIKDNEIHWTFFGKDQKHTGKYSLTLVVNEGAEGMVTTDVCDLVRLVSCTCQADGSDEDGVQTETIAVNSEVELLSGGFGRIDTALDPMSENAVSNAVITAEFGKVNEATSGLKTQMADDKAELMTNLEQVGVLAYEAAMRSSRNEQDKVSKEEGKGLSTNDYTDADKGKLAGLENYDDTAVKQQIGLVEKKADSALEQVADVESELTELSAEVEECSSILKGKTWQDINVRFTDEYYVYAKDNHLIGDIFYNANYKATEFIEVANTDKIRITCASCNGENADKGLVFYDSAKNVIVGLIFSDGTENNAVRELDIPTNAQYVRTTFNKSVGGEFLCQLLLEGESLVSQLEGKAEKKDVEEYDARIMAQDTQSIIAIDLMQLIHSQNKINSIDCLPVISSNSTSITLSQENASYFPTSAEYGIAAVVGYRNGDYKVVYFAASNGNTISRASFETTDLTDVVSVQSVHDTLPNGQGQHLSQSGYIAMGKFVADEILKRTSFVDKNWIGGLVFNELELSRGYTDTDENNAIYDAGGNVVCTPIYNNWMWGGYTPNGSINTRGVEQNADIQKANGWLLKAYRFTQGKKGAYIEFPIKVNGRGFVKIQAANLLDGNCKMTLYADGVAIDATILKKNQTEYIWEDVTINNELRVRWEVMDDADVDVVIYSIGMWKMYPSIPLPLLDSVTRIAVLGDSWTQFPVLNNGLADFAEWNDVVVRPDNSQGDGYGYFPKALAQYTGAIVDNWGKSGMRADNWGLSSINKILDYARYDYLIYNFCINDYNANKTINEWKAVMKRIASKCKPFGTRPIFILPCCTDSPSQSFGLGEWHEATMRGLFVE